MLNEKYETYIDEQEQAMCKPEYWAEKSRQAVEKYRAAKKWGKNSRTHALVAKYAASNGQRIDADGCIYTLTVIDVPGLPLDVRETPASVVGRQPCELYRVGTRWTGHIDSAPEVTVKYKGSPDDVCELEAAAAFAADAGVRGVTAEILRAQANTVAAGFKAETALADGWTCFSPIRDNGLVFRFAVRPNAKSYIA